MPPICALLRFGLLGAAAIAVLEGVLEEVLKPVVVLDVGVTNDEVHVEFWVGRVVAVVLVGVATMIDPDSTISVATNVACVSGAAPD